MEVKDLPTLAFPVTFRVDSLVGEQSFTASGLTKREYFAAMAMQGILSTGDSTYTPSADYSAKKAVQAADALLLELSK